MTTADGAAAVRPVEAELADLVCSDADLLHAEFEAIIAAAWGSDHPPDGPCQPPPPQQPEPASPPPPEPVVRHPRQPLAAGRDRPPGWQRAPPASP